MLARDALVNGPLGSAQASSEGESAALLMVLLGLSCAGLYWAWCRYAGWELRLKLPLAAKAGIALGAIAVLAVGVAAYDPVDKFETFKKPSGPDVGLVEGDFTRSHLISSTGSGRWQLWTSAVDEWETKPVFGRGAGSYQSWWMEHASLPLFVRDAHSLWLETLAELGLVGLLLLVIAIGTGFVAAIARMGRLGHGPAAGGGDGRSAGGVRGGGRHRLDVGAEHRRPGRDRGARDPGRARRRAPQPAAGRAARQFGSSQAGRGRVLRTAGVGVALAAIVFAAVPMLAQNRLEESQAAAARGDAAAAIEAADDARAVQPWASTPYLQLALLEEQQGNLGQANRHIEDALERDRSDWSTWLVAARVQTKAGFIRRGRRSLRQAERLNRRSQLFEALRDRASRSSG